MTEEEKDVFRLGGREFTSRFILGSGKYSLSLVQAAIEHAGAQIITLSVRRANPKERENILDYIPKGVTLLPNTSGARDAKEAVRIARLARELGCGDFVKIEIMRDSKYLLPDNQETIKATEQLAAKVQADLVDSVARRDQQRRDDVVAGIVADLALGRLPQVNISFAMKDIRPSTRRDGSSLQGFSCNPTVITPL